MSIFKERNNLYKKNPFSIQNLSLSNSPIQKSLATPPMLKNKNKAEKPLDFTPRNIYQTPSHNNPPISIPKKVDSESTKIYSSNELKPTLELVQKNSGKISVKSPNKITEKTPENNIRGSLNIPRDHMLLNSPGNQPNITIPKIKEDIKTDNTFFKIPLDNINSSHKHLKLKTYKKSDIFSELKVSNDKHEKMDIIINNKMKVSKDKMKYNKNINKVKKNLNKQLKKLKIEKPIDGVNRNKRGGNILLQKTEKSPQNKKKDKIFIKFKKDKSLDIPKNKIKDFFPYEKNSIPKDKEKEKINKINNITNEIMKDGSIEHIEINIIKNDITKKFLIKNLEKDKNEDKKDIHITKEEKQKNINSNGTEINNNPEIKIRNNISNNSKKLQIKKDNKVYDIVFDEINGDININKSHINNIKNKENDSIIKTLIKDLDIKNSKNKDIIEITKESKNKSNAKKNEIPKAISIIKPEKINIKNNKQLNIVRPILPSKNNKENFIKDRHSIINNNKNKENIIIKNIKQTKEHKDNIIKNKNIEQKPINSNFINDILKRYENSPPQIFIRSKSQIFSKNNKNSSSYIFNKIISSIESKNKIISKINLNHVKQRTDTELHFKPNDFKYLGVIGKGEYGKIFLVQWVANNNQFYAMKYEKFKDYEEAQKNQNITRIIKDFISKTNSDGVIRIYGDVCLKSQNIYHYYTLMEKSERDVEQECIIRNKYLKYYTEKNLIDILCQLILTCSLLQKNCICHGDIKPQNILILNGRYKLSDFGEVKIIDPDGSIEQDIGGTELYMSPKLFFAMKKNENSVIHNAYKSDVFSLALCMLLMATFDFNSIVQIRELTDMKKLKQIVIGFLSKRYSDNLIAFLLWMLQIDESKRPDFIELESKLVRKNK